MTKAEKAIMELVVICAVVVVLALAGLVWDFTSGLIFSGVDGLMILLVCLLLAVVFAGQGIALARKAGWLEFLARKKAAARATAEAAETNPGDQK